MGGPALYGIDAPGTVLKYHVHALGKGARASKGEIEKLDLKNLTCAEAVKQIALIIHKVHDEKDKAFDLEMSWICPQSNNEFHRAQVPRPSRRRRRPGPRRSWPLRRTTEQA